MANIFEDLGLFWAEIADKNQTQRQIQFIKAQLKPGGYILDVACGSGRHTIALSTEGYPIVGLDASPKLLRIAKQRCRTVDVVLGDMRWLPFKSEAFAAAVSMDTSFGYLPSEREDIKSLLEMRRVLRVDGALFVDIFNRTQLMRKYRRGGFFWRLKWAALPFLLKFRSKRLLFWAYKWREYRSFFLLQKRVVSIDGEWLCDLWVIREKTSGRLLVFRHEVRLYALSQLVGMFAQADFAAKKVFGGYECQSFNVDSERLIVDARAL